MDLLRCKKVVKTLLNVSFVMCAVGQCAFGDTNPIDIQMSLGNSFNITQGEPILLHYKVDNSTASTADINVGTSQSEWYTIRLSDSNGKTIAAAPCVTSTNDQLSFSGPSLIVWPHTALEDDVVLTRYFGDLSPGQYTLAVHVQLPYVMRPLSDGALAGQELKNTDPVVTRDFMFPFNIAPVDAVQLRNVAESLQKQYAEERPGTHATALLRQLFSMPEAQAAPSWAICASNPKMAAGFIAVQLASRRSAIAADILAKMLQNPGLSADEKAAINRNLNEMYNDSAPTVKTHIKDIAFLLGISMPDKVTISSHVD